jgi:hypothetical protein
VPPDFVVASLPLSFPCAMDTVTISDMSALNSRFHVFKYTERIISVGLHHIAASRVELTAYRIKNCDVMLTKENCNVLC